MPFTTNDGARIHWEATGSGVPILLIMGHRSASDMWYPVVPELAKHHRVITFDNRGTGQTDTTTNMTLEQCAADALAVLDAAGEPRAHIYGASMGGAIAAEFGMAYPERVITLVLGCTMLKTEKTRRPLLLRLLYRLPRPIIVPLVRLMSSPKSYGSAAPADWVARDRKAAAKTPVTTKGSREQSKAIERYATTAERARERLTMPVLVLHGDEDRVVAVEHGRALAAAIPGAEYVEYKGAGHNYLVATGGAANRTVLEFIDRPRA